MRIDVLAAVAALGLSAPALADPPAQPPSPGALLGFYPASARAAHLEGEATIRCGRDVHLALRACTLVSESAAGQGFGAAALAMAARSPDNPDVNVTEAALMAATPITVRFRLAPPQIDPDLTQMAHVVKRPVVAQQPAPVRIGVYYPAKALAAQVSGAATVHCHVARDGALTGCAAVEETPGGRDFGDAAALVAEREYRMTPLLVDGKPTDEGEADLTIAFAAAPEMAAAATAAAAAGGYAVTDIRQPVWVRTPTGSDFAKAYPASEMAKGISGAAVIRCAVDGGGHLDRCAILGEAPDGRGFGHAALLLARDYQMQAKDADGAPTAGGTVSVTIHFVAAEL
jgi:TonB family protein